MKILVVDDFDDIRRIVKEMLQEEIPEVKIILAEDGDEGLELAKKHHPDIVITDNNMPHMSGRELIQRIREENLKCKIILMTARLFEEVKNYSADKILTKPFTKESLIKAIGS